MISMLRRGSRKNLICFVGVLCMCITLGVQAGSFISNVTTDKAMYPTGAVVSAYVDITNGSGSVFNGSVRFTVTHLGYTNANLNQSVSGLAVNANTTKTFFWLAPTTNFQGYLVSVSVQDANSNVLDRSSSAVDVSSDWRRFPRYGYISQFWLGLDAGNFMWQLKNYHINGLQFYDWSWKHHIPYNAASSWKDVANRDNYRATLTSLITAAHGYNMVAMAYDDWGSAYDNCLSDGSGVTLSMGRFSGAPASSGNQLTWGLPGGWATPQLRLMNNRDPGWQNYIYGRVQQAVTNFGFDGWHMDNLVWDHVVYDYAGNQFNLDDYNDDFINNAKTALGGKSVTFNNVDGSALDQVVQSANVDFIYSELWGGNANYNDLKLFVDNVRRYGSKATVFAAYMNRNKTSGDFNEASVRLANAAMFASGAAHIELGDGGEMLHNEYFPANGVKMTTSLRSAMRSYYDFLVGYQNLLRDDTVSASHQAAISGIATSTSGNAGAVWVIAKKSPGYNILHLINLLNNTSTEWRDNDGTYPAPTTQSNLAVKMYYSGAISGGKLWWASPDVNSGAAAQLSYTMGSDGGGNFINFTVPQLQYWDMIWLELNGTTSAANQLQAENYDSMAGIGTESTTDSGGGANIGSVKNTSGDSYLVFNNVDFGTGPASVSARVASGVANSAIEFRRDSPTGPLLATVVVGNTGGWQNWQTISSSVTGALGVRKLFVVFKNAAANLNWFNFNFTGFNNALPTPWGTMDIGAVGIAGGAAYSNGIFTASGSGTDIEGVADAFRYVYRNTSGNCEVRARVVSMQNTDPWAKAGVMIRESSTAGAVNAAVVMTPANGVAFQRRASTGGGTTSTVISGVTTPQWVRLVRTATNSFRGYYSTDGTNWTQIGASQTINMATNATIGLAVAAHNNATTGVGSFDGVSVNNVPILAAISNQTLIAGANILITNAASDIDVPLQTLTYSVPGAPAGATIDAGTGVLTWRPTIAQSPSTQMVSIVVADNGSPSMVVTQNFTVTVTQPVSPALDTIVLTNGQPGFWVNGDTGPDYTVLTSTNLTSWIPVFTTNSPAVPFFWMDEDAAGSPLRFYRVLLGP